MSSGHDSLVIKVTEWWPAYHEFEPCATEDPRVEGALAREICRGSNILHLVGCEIRRGKECKLRCRPRHLTMVRNDEVRRQ
ncbi:hypothetical protein TNCV_3753651 [Trichonephila clavipes]|nr:hypothetical protein TNCV_3753651 [Trichonephila clavipes]